MATKSFCDRCGEESFGPRLVKIKTVDTNPDRCSSHDFAADLCENCFHALTTFINACSRKETE